MSPQAHDGGAAAHAAPPRRPGRPRDPRILATVLATTADILRDKGVPAVTIEAVSAASGVSKPTIYRYWPHRLALAIDAFAETMSHDVPVADTGDSRRDLLEQVGHVAAYYRSPAGVVLRQLIGASASDPQAAEQLRDRFFEHRRAQTRVLWERVQARGEAHPDIDADTAIDLLFSPLIFRLLVGHGEIDAESVGRLVEVALDGLLRPDRGSTPVRSPSSTQDAG